jgi:peptidoglycan hydrolase-like protein with peptidoglycan-binding domain
MFTSIPSYARYRTLMVTSPHQSGEDVYALQTALATVDFDPGETDGVFGNKTGAAIRSFQQSKGLTLDGKAGGATQKELALLIAQTYQKKYAIAAGALRGQLEHESGFRLGNYSALRTDGSYDAGIAQRNTAHTPSRQGFNVPLSIDALARVIRAHYDIFAGLPVYRRWNLAQGAWNAPAFACYIALQEGASKVTVAMTSRPGADARKAFESYLASVSTYLYV